LAAFLEKVRLCPEQRDYLQHTTTFDGSRGRDLTLDMYWHNRNRNTTSDL